MAPETILHGKNVILKNYKSAFQAFKSLGRKQFLFLGNIQNTRCGSHHLVEKPWKICTQIDAHQKVNMDAQKINDQNRFENMKFGRIIAFPKNLTLGEQQYCYVNHPLGRSKFRLTTLPLYSDPSVA